MIRTLLIALCLLLCGCTGQNRENTAHQRTAPPVAVQVGQDRGSVRIFPLEGQRVTDLRSWGTGLLAFSGQETTLTLFREDDLTAQASYALSFRLDAWDASLVLGEECMSFYDPQRRQTIVLDSRLQACAAIRAPEGLTGCPILAPDGDTLYYIAGSTLRAWDLTSGKNRCVKDFSGLHPELTGLHLEGTVLQCRLREKTLFLDAGDGRTLREAAGSLSFRSRGQGYSCILPAGLTESLIYGEAGEAPSLLLPRNVPEACFFLDEHPGAVTVTTRNAGVFTLDYYDLEQGRRLSALSLASDHVPLAIEDTAGGALYLLLDDPGGGSQTLYRWSPWEAPITDSQVYTFPCSQTLQPEPQALEACQALAEAIGAKYGVQVKLWKQACQVQPWDYTLEPEYQTALLYRELENLDRLLGQYPPEILEKTASHFTSLNLCLVREITGAPESGSLNRATGIQFLDRTDAYVVLAVGPYLEQALYHELFHAMETHILTQSTAFDRWDQLNPAGFQYDLDYLANAERDSGVYLRQEYRAFVDTFSMSYPKEDRARIMEYAMMPGNETVFQPAKMQGKLQALCHGIRDAYNLEAHPGTYPWEQYLED